MEPKELRTKLNGILKALAAGRSCEQILATDHTLSYRDIFHAVAEAPTSYWDRATTSPDGNESPPSSNSIRARARQRTD